MVFTLFYDNILYIKNYSETGRSGQLFDYNISLMTHVYLVLAREECPEQSMIICFKF